MPTACQFIVEAAEWAPKAQTFVDPLQVLQAPNSLWLAALQGDELVGVVGFHSISWPDGTAEVALGVVPAHRGKGGAKHLAVLQNEFAFQELGLRRLQMTSLTGSPACAIAQAAGLKLEGTLKQCRLKRGKYLDASVYALLRED